jgi:hypothetical protein
MATRFQLPSYEFHEPPGKQGLMLSVEHECEGQCATSFKIILYDAE